MLLSDPTSPAAQSSARPDSEAVKPDELLGPILTPAAPSTAPTAQLSAPPDSEAVNRDEIP
jgi:hypothetical protein